MSETEQDKIKVHTRSTDHVIKQEPGSPNAGPSSIPAEDVPAISIIPTHASCTSAQNVDYSSNIEVDIREMAPSTARALFKCRFPPKQKFSRRASMVTEEHSPDHPGALHKRGPIKNNAYKHVAKVCLDVCRLRQYTNAIRHIDITKTRMGSKVGFNAKLFNLLPRLLSIIHDTDRLVLDNQASTSLSSFQPTKVTIYETYDCGPDLTGEEFHGFRDRPNEMPKSWSLSRHVSYISVAGGQVDDHTGLDDAVTFYFENWIYSQGLFALPVDKIFMDFNVDCQSFMVKIRRMKEMDSPMPKELIIAVNEDKSGPPMMSLIEELSTLVEGITMTSCQDRTRDDDYLTISNTTIHEFFANPVKWPENHKVKKLEVLLRAEELDHATIPSDINLENMGRIGHLHYFAITLDTNRLSDHGKSQSSLIRSLPALSQIARGMLKVGGPGCDYALKVNGTGTRDDDKMTGEMLTTLLKREMMEIWRYRGEPVGWRRLTRGERV